MFEDRLHPPEATAGQDGFFVAVGARHGAIDGGLRKGVARVGSGDRFCRDQAGKNHQQEKRAESLTHLYRPTYTSEIHLPRREKYKRSMREYQREVTKAEEKTAA
jgi:hypothetical protein